ncbi:MAG: hypothetical protein E7252_01425 [Lachnospira sp.]|nr:hypothetical protein [Lachnospira sp.]
MLNEFSPIYNPENTVFIYDGALYMAPMREGDYSYFDYDSISIISSNDNEIIFKVDELVPTDDAYRAVYTFTLTKNGEDYIIADIEIN